MTKLPLDAAVALSPARSVVVEACAGSGKTWLLVSRMIRLLLAGAKPSELLAITFTRKAAQEMTSRLYEWLQILATETDEELRKFLRQREIPAHEIDAFLPRARGLLEAVLTAQPGPTITTFHGWFLELLRHAPLEAGLPWGAPLLDRESQMRNEVLDRLLSTWADAPESCEGQALVALLEDIGEFNLRALLNHFMQARTEWLASTQGESAPVESMLGRLRELLNVDEDEDPAAAFWNASDRTACIRHIAQVLEQGSEPEQKKSAAILKALETHDTDALASQILKADGGRYAKKANKKTLDTPGVKAEVFLRNYEMLEDALEQVSTAASTLRIWNLNRHGLLLGHAFLQAYRQAKTERGVLDFADAEWLGCLLLESEEFAPALNIKLDVRYRHVLLDEFQDTNPLQWRALSNWLAESRAADSDMTVFMVGDPKQAIYRFRRGEARVFDVAADFLRTQFDAAIFANNTTRRLAPRVVQAINPVFADVDYFSAHAWTEVNENIPGVLRFVPASAPESSPSASSPGTLRNPLEQARPEAEDKAVHEEARAFAAMLKQGILGKWAVQEHGLERPARYGDVMALVRKRTHLSLYEDALENAGIPFITSRRGGLLHALEAQDIIALLEILLLPHADLKLAHVLKSPLFGCDDTALLQLFQPDAGHGWDSLMTLARMPACPPCLARAARLLSGWKPLAGILPAHDLLDRIYFEGDVEARYDHAAPSAMRPRIAANLRAFLQLALTQDAGRYPSLGGFIRELKTLVDDPDAAPEEGIAADGENAVRLLTIHGAKGLEAPIVWLLGGTHKARNTHHDVLAPWPPQERRPLHFSLFGKSEDHGAARKTWFDEEAELNAREENNLLYVALTRAQQGLLVSGDGTASRDGKLRHPWMQQLAAAWASIDPEENLPAAAPVEATPAIAPIPHMTSPAVGSRQMPRDQSREGAQGEFFHACLERLAPPGLQRNLEVLATRLGLDRAQCDAILAQASNLIAMPAFASFFDPGRYLRARNELEWLLPDGTARRIDRLVETETEVWILDYKTGAGDICDDDTGLRQRHGKQLDEYRCIVGRFYPGKSIRPALLIADGRLITL